MAKPVIEAVKSKGYYAVGATEASNNGFLLSSMIFQSFNFILPK